MSGFRIKKEHVGVSLKAFREGKDQGSDPEHILVRLPIASCRHISLLRVLQHILNFSPS